MKKAFLALMLICALLLLAGCACKHEETRLEGAVEATCTQEGYTGDTVCVKCEEVVQKGEAIPMLEHTPGDLTDACEATCTEAGYTGDVYCQVCGALLTQGEEISALGHEPGERYHVVEPTCTEVGYTGEVDCLRCYQTLEADEEIPALGHTLGEPYNVVEASCTQEGYTGDRDCTVCGETVPGEVVPKLAHDYVDGVCAVCGWMEAGLYAEGERLRTWDELLENGYVELGMDGKRLDYVADSLFGTLVVEEGIEQVGDGDPLCYGGESKLETVYLPASVSAIGVDAFKGWPALKEVRFFGPVEEIRSGAFRDCTALEQFEIPEGLETIPDYMLSGCTSLKSIAIPGWIRVVGMCAFDGCSSLETVELSEGIEDIEGFAFGGTAIHELTLPSTVMDMGDMCGPYSEALPNLTVIDFSQTSMTSLTMSLSGCPSLKTVVFPQGLEEIRASLLGNCYAVEELVLPDGLKEVGDWLFYTHESEQSHLKRVVWPVSLLDGAAFAECPELEEILYRGSELDWNLTLSKDLFEGVKVTFDYEG